MKVIERGKKFFFTHKAVIFIFLLYFLPRLVALGSDMSNYDASFWYPRMDDFTKNMVELDYGDTYQQYHPGLTLLWLSGTSKYLFQTAFEYVFHYNPRYVPQQFIRLNAVSIFPLVFVISLLGSYCYFLLSKITNKKFALIFSILLSFEPFFFGMSKFLHLSAIGGMFSYASFLSFYYYYKLKRDGINKARYFYYAPVLMGFAMLSKIDAVLAMIFTGLAITYFEIIQAKTWFKGIKSSVWSVFLYGILTFITFCFFFPSMWVEPVTYIKKIIAEGVVNTGFEENEYDAYSISGNTNTFYIEIIFIRNLPTTFILMMTGLIYLLYKRLKKQETELLNFVLIGGFFYVLVLLFLITIPGKHMDRYLSNIYPSIMVLATYGFFYFYDLGNKSRKILIGILIFAYTITAYRYYPAYSYYHTDFLGGPWGIEKTQIMRLKNRGEFFAQGAQYINQIDPDAPNKVVIPDSREQMRTFPPYFYGKAYSNPRVMPAGKTADYILIRPEWEYILPTDHCTYMKSFGVRAPLRHETVKVYKCEGLDTTFQDYRN